MIPFDFSIGHSQNLRNLGLSEYEIRVFLTLLLGGSQNYRVLCQDSGVPTGKIYQVLSSLESKGFIEVAQDKPKIFSAVEPKKALRRRLRQIEDDFLDLEQKTAESLQALQMQYSLKYGEGQSVMSKILVSGTSSAEGIRENLLKAENEVLFSAGENFGVLRVESLLGSLLNKGVVIKAIVSPSLMKNKEEAFHLAELGVNIRYFESIPSRYFVVDDKSASLFIDRKQDTCVIINSAVLCHILKENFSEIWNRAILLQRQLNSAKVVRNL